jgi:hypothetical protein
MGVLIEALPHDGPLMGEGLGGGECGSICSETALAYSSSSGKARMMRSGRIGLSGGRPTP